MQIRYNAIRSIAQTGEIQRFCFFVLLFLLALYSVALKRIIVQIIN